MGEDKIILVLMGPPGAGKGTQALLLQKSYKVPWISTGQILREAVQKGDKRGKSVRGYLEQGKLVPDELMNQIVEARLKEEDCKKGFILDGFPRTWEQARELDRILEKDASALKVINIKVSLSSIIKRICGRRTCKECGKMYHTLFHPPAVEGVCDNCGGFLYQREDDTEEVVKERIRVYNIETKPVVEYYADRVLDVDGEARVEEVFLRIKSLLDDKVF